MVTSMYQLLPFAKNGFGNAFKSKNNNDTSIASNMQGSTSKEQQLQDISSLVANNGGDMKTFKSESEYLKAMNAPNRVTTAVQEPIATNISQRIIVLDYLTSQPLQNVAVWIDDMPRFTNREGVVSTIIDKSRVYLLVEQDDYIPYMEYMEVSNNDKVIYLKMPSDDLNISAVWLSYNDDVANLLTQDYGIDMDDNDIDNATIEIKANVDADEYRIFQDGRLVLQNSTGIFENIKLKELFLVGGNISVQIHF
jgi:hypothetical protein